VVRRFAPSEEANTGILRFAQNDDVKQTTAGARTEAGPCGMTNKKGNGNKQGNGNKSNGKGQTAQNIGK
jgi:hypothetical protein